MSLRAVNLNHSEGALLNDEDFNSSAVSLRLGADRIDNFHAVVADLMLVVSELPEVYLAAKACFFAPLAGQGLIIICILVL